MTPSPEDVERTMNLAARCDEILSWRQTGIYEGTVLQELAETLPGQADAGDPPIRRAESITIREALEQCAALSAIGGDE